MIYTTEQIRFLEENAWKCRSWQEVTEKFNDKFKTHVTECGIQQKAAKNLHLRIDSVKNSFHYSKEMSQFLSEEYSKSRTYQELADKFNSKFNQNRSVSQIREKCTKRLNLHGMANPTTFKQGHAQSQCPIGTIRETSNGTTYIKVKMSENNVKMTGYQEPYWLPIQKKIFQDYFGEIPKGKMVIFLDGNSHNLSIDNLYPVDRRMLVTMAKNKWYTEDIDHTLTAVKWCELYYTMKDSKAKEKAK